MHRHPASLAAPLAAALLLLSTVTALAADAPDDWQAGREALGRGDGPAAVSALESALLSVAPADRPALLDDLRQAYERAAAQAEAAGDDRRARVYRENLLIIDRSKRSAGGQSPPPPPSAEVQDSGDDPPAVDESEDAPSSATPESGQALEPAPPSEPEAPASMPPASEAEPAAADAMAGLNLPRPEASPPSSTAGSTSPERSPSPSPDPSPAPQAAQAPSQPPKASVADQIRAADALFREEKYDEAGRIYAALADRNALPESHAPVWAYCRFLEVARKINAQPSSPAEWSAIHAEIREVRALAPEIWFSEYLRRLAAERSAVAGAKPSAFIVRGQSATEESGEAGGAWQVIETENFRIFHADAVLADRIARRAERARSDLLRYWTGAEPVASWSPRCDLYVYPDAAVFSRLTGQPDDSPGFSTMGLSGGQVVARRINLRADYEGLVEAVVPHEVAHVVLADLFPNQQIPRWVDEGIAVLAEPAEAQANRLSDLDEPLSSGRVFGTEALMHAAMPDGRYWDLFIAQSASLTRYLLGLDSPNRLVTFLKESERLGAEAALRLVYGFEGFDDLHHRWLSHARRTRPREAIAARPVAETLGQ